MLNDVVWRDGKPASPRTPEELVVADGAAAAVAAFQAAGYLTFVVTNQPDVRRGKMTAKALLGEAIAASGVEKCDALIDGKVQQPGHLRLIEASVADLACAQSQHRDP